MLPKDYLHTLTPAELISWVSGVTLAEISKMTTVYLNHIGWYNNPVVKILYSMTSAGVWIARVDTSGDPKMSVMDGRFQDVMGAMPFIGDVGATMRVEGFTTASSMSALTGMQEEYALINKTLAAGGTLAASEIIADPGAGASILINDIHLELEPATSDISGVGGNSAVIEIEDGAGTPVTLGWGVLSHSKQECNIRNLKGSTPNVAINLVATAGTAGNVGASIIRGYVRYRTIT